MANKYAVASGLWSATSTWSDTDGGGGGATVPADGDAVFILINVSVQMDVDQSAFTGLLTVTIRGHATTPAMLYWKDGASGWLKIRTTYKLVGTTGTLKGRLLANSNGTWGGTTSMANAVLTDNTTWVQFTIPAFTPAAAAHVRYRAWLKKHESSSGVYVDAELVR